ncbi:MAG: radical SAM protein [Anaerolineae bacterium]|nr:radical SAM protein [Anaerolineae bacterium]
MGRRTVTPPVDDASGGALRIARFLPVSCANGPGQRAVIWVQGCTLGCPGCFNPAMHDPQGGDLVPVEALLARILAIGDAIEGVSFSGGEPLQQMAPLLALLRSIRRGTGLSVLVFTGYTWEEIQALPDAAALLCCVDVLIAGRYDAAQYLGQGMLGSTNQTVHLLTSRYTMADIQAVPPAEVIITEDGDVIVSGVAPVRL